MDWVPDIFKICARYMNWGQDIFKIYGLGSRYMGFRVRTWTREKLEGVCEPSAVGRGGVRGRVPPRGRRELGLRIEGRGIRA